ncbi:MAG: DUF2065 domain-containing protein [Pseudomonadota bacterium]
MDLIAALALVMVLEGLALAVFARSIPQVLSEIDLIGPGVLRRMGLVAAGLGAVLYLWVRS